MTKLLSLIALCLSFAVFADKPKDSVYIDGGDNKSALILAHGQGKHPKWLVVNPLRKGVNAALGFHTLSLQMPIGHDNWKDYADDFPSAHVTIKDAIRFLKEEKGVTKIFLMGHSMGSRMSGSFVAENPHQPLAGLIIAGCRNNGEKPLSCIENVEGISMPILDVWGGGNGKDVDSANERSGLVSETYKQVEIPGANHKFKGHEAALVSAGIEWLKVN